MLSPLVEKLSFRDGGPKSRPRVQCVSKDKEKDHAKKKGRARAYSILV